MNRRYLLILILLFELVAVFQLCSRIISILQTDSRIQSTRLQRDILKKDFQSKQYTFGYVRTDLYVEEIARSKLRYSYANEQMYIIRESNLVRPELPPVNITQADVSERWGEIVNWFNLFFK